MCHLSLAVEIVNQLIPDQKTFSCKESSIEDIVFFAECLWWMWIYWACHCNHGTTGQKEMDGAKPVRIEE